MPEAAGFGSGTVAVGGLGSLVPTPFQPSSLSFQRIAFQTDLNGDGKPEILVGSPLGRLLLVAPQPGGNGFAPAKAGREVEGWAAGLP